MKKVLIIEDNKDIRENTAELLEFNNYSVFTAENGIAGFASAKKINPDIILCDMLMPKSDGMEFLRLASNDNFVRDIPLIYFSAGSLSFEIKKGLIREAVGYLRKPFTENQLLMIIEKGLEK
jgi:CheY-like chemotaxis protein